VHCIVNAAFPFRHVSEVLCPFPVSDTWVKVTGESYDDRCKIVLLHQPVPFGINTEYAGLTKGVLGPDLPSWLGMMLDGKIRAASRDVPVTVGSDFLTAGIDPHRAHHAPGLGAPVHPSGGERTLTTGLERTTAWRAARRLQSDRDRGGRGQRLPPRRRLHARPAPAPCGLLGPF
jgi:hypothetical protein